MAARVIATYTTRAEADLVVARLSSEGIVARSVTDSAGGVEPQLEMIRGVRVVVSSHDTDEAARLLGVDPPAPETPLTSGQARLVKVIGWAGVLVAAFGLVTALAGVFID